MKTSKQTPYIFLCILIGILLFIGGVRYGKRIEEKNKELTYMLSSTPLPSPSPTIKPTISYTKFEHEACNVSFLYPSYMNKKEESSMSALLESTQNDRIQFTCAAQNKTTPTMNAEEKTATASVQINNKTIIGEKKLVEKNNTTYNEVTFTVQNPTKKTQVSVTISENIVPLFEQTFTFTP